MSELTLDSKEEMYFTWYLHELQQAGYIRRWKYQPKPFPLTASVKYSFQKKLKTKTKTVERVLLKAHKYQADFLIIWADEAINIFFKDQGSYGDPMKFPFMAEYTEAIKGYRSIIDVKGSFNAHESLTKFSISQKWVWNVYRIYIQKIVPVPIFKRTFTPQRYLLSDKKKQRRKFNYTPISLAQFIADNPVAVEQNNLFFS